MSGPVFPKSLALVLLCVCSAAVSYLWLTGRCDDLGMSIKRLERERDDLQRKIVTEESKWSNMTSPQNMQRLIESHGLTMTWPSEKFIIRIRRDFAPARVVLAQNQAGSNGGRVVHD